MRTNHFVRHALCAMTAGAVILAAGRGGADTEAGKAVRYLNRTNPCFFWWGISTMDSHADFQTRVFPGDLVYCAYNGTVGAGVNEASGCVLGLFDIDQGGHRATIKQPGSGGGNRLPVLAPGKRCNKDLVLRLIQTEPEGRPFLHETRWNMNFLNDPRAHPQLSTGGNSKSTAAAITSLLKAALDRLPVTNEKLGYYPRPPSSDTSAHTTDR